MQNNDCMKTVLYWYVWKGTNFLTTTVYTRTQSCLEPALWLFALWLRRTSFGNIQQVGYQILKRAPPHFQPNLFTNNLTLTQIEPLILPLSHKQYPRTAPNPLTLPLWGIHAIYVRCQISTWTRLHQKNVVSEIRIFLTTRLHNSSKILDILVNEVHWGVCINVSPW